MAHDATNLVWLDMEMTGLKPDSDRILELAIVVTDTNLSILAESEAWAVHQEDAALDGMDEWNWKTHSRSGLLDRVRASSQDEAEVEAEALLFVRQFAPPHASPMCGNTIGQDRRFMARYMPALEDWFHYRNLDVSTLKELCKRWRPDVYKKFRKRGAHTALLDIHESIDELKHYREHFIQI
ncbi:MAG: oligoribonuclease [Zoogloeaceae bacterium]|jgi:oligoribonuclease|nr:oligoribonuclease [Zoogloeaceae bacterium]